MCPRRQSFLSTCGCLTRCTRPGEAERPHPGVDTRTRQQAQQRCSTFHGRCQPGTTTSSLSLCTRKPNTRSGRQREPSGSQACKGGDTQACTATQARRDSASVFLSFKETMAVFSQMDENPDVNAGTARLHASPRGLVQPERSPMYHMPYKPPMWSSAASLLLPLHDARAIFRQMGRS